MSIGEKYPMHSKILFALTLFLSLCGATRAETLYETSFADGKWVRDDWKMLKSARSGYLGRWIQREDRIVNFVPPEADIHSSWGTFTAMVLKRPFSGDVTITAQCGFEQRMAPGILVVAAPEPNEPEVPAPGEHFEIILYDNGLNIWHHYFENGTQKWYNLARLRANKLFAPGVPHTLTVRIFSRNGRRFIEVTGDGRTVGAYFPQMFPDHYRIGIVASEGDNFFGSVKISRP